MMEEIALECRDGKTLKTTVEKVGYVLPGIVKVGRRLVEVTADSERLARDALSRYNAAGRPGSPFLS